MIILSIDRLSFFLHIVMITSSSYIHVFIIGILICLHVKEGLQVHFLMF